VRHAPAFHSFFLPESPVKPDSGMRSAAFLPADTCLTASGHTSRPDSADWYHFIRIIKKVYIRLYRPSTIAKLVRFLYRITTKIRSLGLAKERARFLTGFIVMTIVIVTVLSGTREDRQNQECSTITGRSTGCWKQIVSVPSYPPFGIHR
jgi:hypothetical protein